MERSKLTARFSVNPDVVLREEDEDGGLLFNPDTNQIRVLNPTGIFIWKHCDGRHDFQSIIAGLKDAFDQVPDNEVADQVEAFVEDMKANGFIGAID